MSQITQNFNLSVIGEADLHSGNIVTIGQLTTNVYYALGQPDASICGIEDTHYAVRQETALLVGLARTSDNNQTVNRTLDIDNLNSPHDITSAIGTSSPAWVEIKSGADKWAVLRVCNRAQLPEMRQRGVIACAFYGEEYGGEGVTQYIDFSFEPDAETVIRIWYDQDAVLSGNAAQIPLPANLTLLIELKAQNTLIPRIINKLADTIESEEMRKMMQLKTQALQGIMMQNEMKITEYNRLFRIWKNRTRSAQAQSSLPARSGRHLYGR